ncbi:MATE family efflux transporter [Comamonas humi]
MSPDTRQDSDLSVMARHAGTVFAGQIAVMGFGVVDTIVAGRHSELALAALSVGSAIYVSVYVSLMGLLQALLPVWSEMHGARRLAELGPSLRQSLYVCFAATVLGLAVLFWPDPILRRTEIPQELRPLVAEYLAIVGFSLPGALLFRVFSTLNQALGRPQLVTWLQLCSLLVKLPLSVWFTFGGFGLPAMGVVGCAWATLAVTAFLFVVGAWLLRTQPLYAPLHLWRRLEAPHGPTLREFLRLGVPTALSVLVEVTSFTLMALFIARIGTAASGAHQIAANVAALLYMVPLSVGIAVSARVSWWRGAGDEARARATAWTGIRAAALMVLALAALLFFARPWVADIYSETPAVVALATGLLAWVALYHLADGVQTVCIFVLRCYRITLAPLAVYCVLLWGLGLFGGFVAAYGPHPNALHGSPAAFWAGAAVALACAAIAFVGMLRYVTARARPLPALEPAHG